MTVVLDSGAFIAVERNDKTLKALLIAARDESTFVVVPATVVAETWCGSARDAKVARLIKSTNECVPLTFTAARETGELLAKSRNSTLVDANVVSIAIARRPSTIVTSDPDDIARLLQDAQISFARESAANQKVDVTIVSV